MAILGTYRINQADILPSQSGNGIIALFNKVGSGKILRIKNIEIQNFRRDTIGTQTRVADFEIFRISSQTSGTEITPSKLDTNATTLPSQIKIYTGGNPVFSTQTITISTTTTLAFAIGPPGTITRAAGSWLTDGIIQGARVSITGSTSNNNTFRVRSTTGTAITVETQYPVVTEGANASAVATANIPISLGRFSVAHSFFAANTNAFMNKFNLGDKGTMTGSVYNSVRNFGGTVQPIRIAEGEGISISMRNSLDLDAAAEAKEFHHYLVEVMFSADYSPAKTYYVSQILTPDGEENNLISIMNNTGSGRNIDILDIVVSEIGDISTPYFMVVPFDAIEPLALEDPARDVPYMKMDSASPSITSYIEIKKDVPLFPKGFNTGGALFPLSFGSAVPANGLNYLITKDFLGPIYGAFFPEKSELAANPTTAVTNNFHSISQKETSLFTGNDMYLSENEGIAIVAAAEPLGGIGAGTAQQVNKYSMGKYDFSINFSVEDVTRTLTLTGLQTNSEIRIYSHNTTTELAGIENSSTTFAYEYVYAASTYVDVVILHNNYQYYKIENLLLENTNSSIPVQQILDRVYSNT